MGPQVIVTQNNCTTTATFLDVVDAYEYYRQLKKQGVKAELVTCFPLIPFNTIINPTTK